MTEQSRGREWLLKVLFLTGIAAILFSFAFPYWRIKVVAPQYPKGLSMVIYINRLSGDIQELNTLNHYIGMRHVDDAAKTERKFAIPGVAVVVLSLFSAMFYKGRFRFLLILPAVLFPIFFAADLYYWLRDSGLNLDPKAPLNRSIKPFIPPVFGEGKIAQFKAYAQFEFGFYLNMLCSFLSILGLMFQNRRKVVSRIVSCIFYFLFLAQPMLYAENLVVSQEGPYRDLQQAIHAASNGDTVIVKGGVYAGPFVIDKSLHLIGEDFPVLDGQEKGTVVTVNADDVQIKGFTIRGSGDILSQDQAGLLVSGARARIEQNRFENVLFGIDLKRAPESVIRKNYLEGKILDVARRGDLIRIWYSDNVTIEDNVTIGGRDAVLWFSKNLIIRGNEFLKGRYGLHFMYCNDSVVENNRLQNNSVGIYLMYSAHIRLTHNQIIHNRGPSGFGVGFKDMEHSSIEENIVADNRVGFFIDHGSGHYEKNLIALNDIGIQMLPTALDNSLTKNSFIDNGEQVSIDGMGGFMKNQWQGNFWSDYRGYDRDHDGAGDMAYQAFKFFERLTDRYGALKFFALNPSVQALDFANTAFPIFSPKSKFTDPLPSIHPILPAFPGMEREISWPFLFASFFLFLPLLLMRRMPAFNLCAGSAQLMSIKSSSLESQAIDPIPNFIPSRKAAIHVSGLNKNFRKQNALKDLNFDIQKGETVVLWGSNGAGKTTALRCLLGSVSFEGNVFVLGHNVKTNGKLVRSHIGYVPQEIRLYIDQTVLEIVSFYAALKRVPRARVKELLKRWGLSEFENRFVNHLSGGMKQKLALVIALLSDPEILFLDEPTSNLDLKARHEFLSFLTELKLEGKTILLCSHLTTEVWRLADRVIVLDQGEKISEGLPESVRHFLGGSTVLFLAVSEKDEKRALELLKFKNFQAELNHAGIMIHVSPDKKMEPFRVLQEAGISVLDFEVGNETNQKRSGHS